MQKYKKLGKKMGKLYVVGIGPGDMDLITPMALVAIKESGAVCGYDKYVNQVRDFINEDAVVFINGMRGEEERVEKALELTKEYEAVSLICGGDASLYSLASLVCEKAEDEDFEIIPGITAAMAASAKLGGILSNDIAIISMSDLLTPWEKILKRIEAVNIGDFVCAIYNPKSMKRISQLPFAINKFKERGDLPLAVVKNCYRENEEIRFYTLNTIDYDFVDMSSIVMIGNTETIFDGERLITPRGYGR